MIRWGGILGESQIASESIILTAQVVQVASNTCVFFVDTVEVTFARTPCIATLGQVIETSTLLSGDPLADTLAIISWGFLGKLVL
jgi:hypothetical protein